MKINKYKTIKLKILFDLSNNVGKKIFLKGIFESNITKI